MRTASGPLWGVVLVMAIVLACSDDDGGAGPVEPPEPVGPPPSVLATVSLSDAPVEGELLLTPPEDGPVWDFAVDLDGDGAFDDAEGQVDGERRVPYRFTEAGLHPLAVRFERPGTRVTVDRTVAVNDPDAFVVEARFTPPPGSRPEGIAVTRDNEHLFVAYATGQKVVRLRTDGLVIEDDLSLREELDHFLLQLEGLALSSSQNRLFLIHSVGLITVLSVPELEILGFPEVVVRAMRFIEAVDESHVVTSGDASRIERVDVETGTVTAFHEVPRAGDLELSPERDSVVVVTEDFGEETFAETNRVLSLDAKTLQIRWETEMSRPAVLDAAAFHPSGNRIYVFGRDGAAFWLFVVRAGDGNLLQEIRIEPSGLRSGPGVANPSAITHDGRFVIFPTAKGAYLVDTALDAPVLRLSDPGVDRDPRISSVIGCCDVATPESTNAIYFANGGNNEVIKVRLAR